VDSYAVLVYQITMSFFGDLRACLAGIACRKEWTKSNARIFGLY
jgi:hypothetical protein